MKFTLKCNAQNPCEDCKGEKKYDLPSQQAAQVRAAFAKAQGLCTPCVEAGAAPKDRVRRGSVVERREPNPEEIIEVTCWNHRCVYGERVTPAYVKEGKVVREERRVAAPAKVRVARKDAPGAKCEGCIADDKKAEAAAKRKAARAGKKA